MALVNHKKLKIDDDDAMEKDQNKTDDLAKKSLHDLSQVSKCTRIDVSLQNKVSSWDIHNDFLYSS